jgi:serine/threonine-protein kinase
MCGACGAPLQGLVHRDLKPENVFIAADRHAVLLDFDREGLAAPASTTTQDGGVRGTPAYMAPERFFGQPAACRPCLRARGRAVRDARGTIAVGDLGDPEARLSPRPLVELAPVPAELDVEIRRAMSTRAQNRPPTATAFLDAVRGAAGGVEVPAASETAKLPQAVTTAPADRKPWFADRQPTTDRGKDAARVSPDRRGAGRWRRNRARKWPWIRGADHRGRRGGRDRARARGDDSRRRRCRCRRSRS